MTKNLLVADDSITIQKVVRLTFAGEDVNVESAPDGNMALEKAREMKPDVVLADVCMPGRNGYELCESIKSEPELSRIPVVLIVGTFEPFDESEAKRVNCDGRLTKPFDTSELREVVYSLMGLEVPAARPEEEESKVQDNLYQEFVEPSPSSAADRLVSDRTRESFLGDNRVLDLFSPDFQRPVSASSMSAPDAAAKKAEPPRPAGAPEISEETINLIVERVLRRMSQEVIREVAWEVVPEMSELIIRQCLEEKGKP